DDTDRAEVEALLAGSAEARSFVEETRATAQLLTEHLHREPSPGLAPEHHRAIERTLETQSRVDSPPILIPIEAPSASPTPTPAGRCPSRGRVVRVAVAAGIVAVLGILLVPSARKQPLPQQPRPMLALAPAEPATAATAESAPALSSRFAVE